MKRYALVVNGEEVTKDEWLRVIDLIPPGAPANYEVLKRNGMLVLAFRLDSRIYCDLSNMTDSDIAELTGLAIEKITEARSAR